MKITAIETFPTRIPLKHQRRMVSALGRHERSDFLLIRVTCDDGSQGVGEATVTPRWSGETVWGAQALLDEVFTPALLGCDPRDRSEIEHRMDALAVDNWFAKSAIEMALWDLAGRAAGVPVFELLAGPVRPLTVHNRFSLGAYTPDVAAQRAAERVAAGFDTIKVKVGTDPQTDIDRVLAVRQAVGGGVTLTIDANGGWDAEQARHCLKRLAVADIAWVEQPLPRGNYSDLRRLRQQLGCRVLADESCFDLVEARELILQQCCDALTLYPGKQGGIAKARAIASLAAQHGIICTIGSNLEWDVGAAAMLHFVVATENVQVERLPGDCLGPAYHEFSIAREPLQIDGPRVTLSRRAGLGIEVDWQRVLANQIDHRRPG